MSHRALVIGVEDYLGQASLSLRGAINDAISFAGWLIDPAGGAVPADKVTLLTSHSLTSLPPELAGVDLVSSAIAGQIIQQLLEIPNKPADPSDRFYFYFSGHGLTAPNDIAQEAILPSDFTFLNTGAAIGVRAIQDWLKTSRFNQQFLFIDACRNAMLARRFSVPIFAIPEPAQLRPQVEQFVFMATSRGLSAAEAEVVGNTRAGVFTAALIDGLRGAGEAKLYNVSTHTYEVTSSSLVPYLTKTVRKQIAALTVPNGANATSFLQIPTLTGERFSEPVICSFNRDAIKKVILSINLEPSDVNRFSKVVVERDDIEVHVASPVPNIPYDIHLEPKEYSVTARASNYKSEPVAIPLRLYDNSTLHFRMIPDPPVPAAASAQTQVAVISSSQGRTAVVSTVDVAALHSNSAALSASASAASETATVTNVVSSQFSDVTFSSSFDSASAQMETDVVLGRPAFTNSITETDATVSQSQFQTGLLKVETADESSALEIEFSGNEKLSRERAVVASGRHRVEATLSPGLYTARLWAPNGLSVEKLVLLKPGTTESVWLAPPALAESDPILELASQTGFHAMAGVVTLSESSGLSPLAWVRLSTVLSMAAVAQVFPSSALSATRLRSLGLTSLTAIGSFNSAIQIVVGDEMRLKRFTQSRGSTLPTREHAEIESVFVASLALESAYIENQKPLIINPRYEFFGEQSIPLQPGAYWLCIRDHASSGTFVPITVLPNRVSTIVFTRNSRGRVSIFMYQPSASAADPQETMRADRRLEMAQRYLMSGQMGDAELLSLTREGINGEQLIEGKQCDPLGALLGVYLSLRAFERQQSSDPAAPFPNQTGIACLERLVDDLAEHFGFIPDTHVLRAEFQLKAGGREAALASVIRAFDSGLPMLDDVALRLAKLASILSVDHSRVGLLRKVLCRRIPGMLWTVCALDRSPQVQDPLPAPAAWPDPLTTQDSASAKTTQI